MCSAVQYVARRILWYARYKLFEYQNPVVVTFASVFIDK